MKFVRRIFDVHYSDVTPEISVDRRSQFFRRKVFGQYDICHLAFRVDTRICSPRTNDANLPALKNTQHSF